MTVEENKALVRRWNDEIWCKGNVDAADEFMSTNYVFNWAAPGMTSDRDGYKKAVAMQFAAFPDLRVTIDDMIAEGDKVVIRWTGNSTHKNEFMGIAPTNKKVKMTGISIVRIAGGKIMKEWSEMDMMGMMQQLGMFPPPP